MRLMSPRVTMVVPEVTDERPDVMMVPSSTSLARMTPSRGAVMVVYPSIVAAFFTLACALRTLARALTTAALRSSFWTASVSACFSEASVWASLPWVLAASVA